MRALRRLVRSSTALAAAFAVGGCGSVQPTAVPRADPTPGPASSGVAPAGRNTTPTPTRVPARPVPVDCRKSRCVALTFDAGPGPDTARLLDVLRTKGVSVTFFLLGKNTRVRPELVRREASEGHELANHTWTHRRLTQASPAEIRRELVTLQDQVEQLTGRAPSLMRPPQGLTDPRVAEVCRSLGLAQILWSVTAKDYRDHDPDVITNRVLQGAQRNGIILLHDVYPGTVPAVPAIIDGLRRRGLTPVTVSQLFAPARPEPGRAYWTAPSA
ncbi:polysaccharide deacetylase family protein [Streptomyces sp. NPDC101206]|uniref:polysaccharide deacetylase family protein n=1 Tax=Streptomyces sp. NPDC101206 TaxID=3366128 RepID=UPI00382A649C